MKDSSRDLCTSLNLMEPHGDKIVALPVFALPLRLTAIHVFVFLMCSAGRRGPIVPSVCWERNNGHKQFHMAGRGGRVMNKNVETNETHAEKRNKCAKSALTVSTW